MKTYLFRYNYIILVSLLLAFTSCKTPKTLITENIRPISANKLIEGIEANAFDYNGLDIKRISCVYEDQNGKTTFRATLKSAKDKYILITLSKINVPVARLLLTPDSVKMINYIDKSYFIQGYDFVGRFVSADIDFYTVQSILTSNVFSYREDDFDENDYKEFVSYADSGRYVLQSFKNRKLSKITQKGKEEKIDRFLKKMDDDEFIVQYLYVDPETFKINKIVLDDISNDRKVTVDFSNFQLVDDQLYPGNIDVHFQNEQNALRLNVELSRFSTDYDPEYNFNIPERYDRVYFVNQ